MGPEFRPSPPQGGKKISTKHALDYLTMVKKTFEDAPDLYDKFLVIMKDFKSTKICVQEVKDKVLNLFNGHDDVLVGFNMFLPEGDKIRIPEQKIRIPGHELVIEPVNPPVQMEEAMSFVNLIKARFAAEPSVYNSFLNILNLYKTHQKSSEEVSTEVQHLFEDYPDLHSRFLRFLPSGGSLLGQRIGSFRREDFNSDITFQIPQPVKVGNLLEQNERTSKDSEVCDHSDGIEKESDPVSKKQQMFGTHQSIHYLSDEDIENTNDEEILDFFKRVRERLEPGAYQDFLKCVDLQRVGAFTTKSLEVLASGLFVDYPDLVDGFKEIILTRGKNGFQLLNGENGVSDEEKRKIERERLERRTRTPPLLAKEKYNLCKPVSELDLSNCKQCTPSYRLLPEYYPVPPANHRTDFEKSVLNDTWVSVTSGSEDYSFKHMRKNQYEESLFRCEDDRFEMDMLVMSVKSTIMGIEKMMKRMNEGSMDIEEPIEIEDYLTPMNLRCIEKLYGDHGIDAIEHLQRKPEAALPVVLDRLKLKLEEWCHCHTEFNKVWAGVYAMNYHKSLDHRSFYFKQQDMKNLSSKALQAEINEKHEKNLGEDTNLVDIGAKFIMSGTPDMEFDFLDSDLHEDLYQVIRYSCSEVFSAEQTRKFLDLWTALLEHFLGVSNQQQKSEVALEELKSTSQGRKACIVLVGESAGSEAVADKSSKTASPGDSDVPGPPSEAQRRGVSGFICKTDVTVEAVARHLSGSKTSAPSQDGKKRPHGSNSPKVDREDEREEGEILPEPGDSDEETSLSSGAGNGVQRREELSGSTDKDENEEDEGELDHQEKMESEGEADTCGIVNSPSSHNFTTITRLARPLAKHWTGTFVGKENRVFYGNGHFYVLFRLHQVFYERMLSAKNNSIDEGKRQMSSMGSSPDLYSRFKRALYNLLNGSSDSAKFEDECRATCGTHSYVLFTLDKLIFKIIKQLQAIESDAMAMKLIQLYNYEKSHKRGRIVDHIYYHNARAVVRDDAIYRFESGSNMTRLAIQLMDVVPANLKDPNFCEDQWKDDFFLSEREETAIGCVYLKRCMQKRNSHNGEELDGIRVQNGLECKVSGATSKVVYVLHTEDFMYRKCKRRRHL